MTNLFYYLEYYGNDSFSKTPFNDIDSLILSELAYVKLENLFSNTIVLKDLCQLFLNKYSEKDFKNEDYLFPNSYRLMTILQNCPRFNKAVISYYLENSGQTQFGALTIRMPSFCYVAFLGTDSSILGWQEDLELIYQYPTKFQECGVRYLNKTIKFYDRNIYVGGHSKGGNIAMYATMKAKPRIFKRIINVYNFDGPGFLDDVINTYEYQKMTSKLKMFVPEQSIFGMILGHQDYQVVKSSSSKILSHDGYSWQVFGKYFVKGTLSKKSKRFESELKSYLDNMSESEKKLFVASIAQICNHLNITNVMQYKNIHFTSIINFLKEMRNIPEAMKKRFIEVVKMFLL